MLANGIRPKKQLAAGIAASRKLDPTDLECKICNPGSRNLHPGERRMGSGSKFLG